MVQEWINRELPWFSWSKNGSIENYHGVHGPIVDLIENYHGFHGPKVDLIANYHGFHDPSVDLSRITMVLMVQVWIY